MQPTLIRAVMLGCVGSLLWANLAHAQRMGSVTVQVSGLQSREGNLCFKLFNGAQGFPNQNNSAVQRECVAIADNQSADTADAPFSFSFNNLAYGTYAIAIYHDRNGDQQLNRGLFGMPTEGYGFSNDAPATTGPAKYKDALFLLAGSNTSVPIQMHYPQ